MMKSRLIPNFLLSSACLLMVTDAASPSVPVQASPDPSSLAAFAPDTTKTERPGDDKKKEKGKDRTSSGPITDLTLTDIIPPAPAAMEIAKGVAYPVDLSSGLLNIEIPLYEVVSGDIRIPITLSYHASGLKPGIRSRSWLPQGWSLSAGPSLTRVIHGGPDEYVYNASIAAEQSPTWYQLNQVVTQAVDIALDEFYYSLPGHSGRLYFKRTPSGTGTAVTITPVTVPSEPLAVSLPGSGDFQRQVDITDPLGTVYRFGSPTDNSYLDRTYASFGGASLDAATSWKIRTVTSASSGGTVSFEYTTPLTETTFYNYCDELAMIDEMLGPVTYTAPVIRPGLGGSTATPPTYVYSDSAPGHITAVDPQSPAYPQGYVFPAVTASESSQTTSYPSRISFPGGSVVFECASTSGGGRKLSKIRILAADDTTSVREITFTQSAETDGELRLDRLTISSGSAVPESWSFTYNGSAPPRQTRDIDRWGYYNHAGNTTLVPTVTAQVTLSGSSLISTVTVPGGDRGSNESYMQAGVLTGVTYPTGGKAEFTYEAHRYLDPNTNAVTLAGGLRIKSVKETAASGQSTWRHFTYGTSVFRNPKKASGTGLPAVVPMHGTTITDPLEDCYRETACHEFTSLGSLVVSYKERVWTDNSMAGLFSDHGSSVLYPFVMETVSSDASGNSVTGALLHCFNVTTSHPIKTPGTPLLTDSRDGWTRGEETSTLTLRGTSVASAGQNLADAGSLSLTYVPEISQGSVKTGQAYKGHRVYGADESTVSEQFRAISHVWSLPVTGRRLLVARNETIIESNGTFSSSESFTYDAFNNISVHTVTGSRRSDSTAPSRTTRYRYPQDDNSSVHSAMVSANMVSVPVKTEEYAGSVSTANLLTTRETVHKGVSVGSGSASRTAYVPGTESLTVNASASDGGAPSSGTRTLTLGAYDKRGNAMERTGLDGRTEVVLWGYRGRHPVARVRGAALSNVISHTDTSLLNTGSQELVSEQLEYLRNAYASNSGVHVETWTWTDQGGVASATDPSGRSASYTYDALGRLTGSYAHDGTASRLLESHTYTVNQTMPVPSSSSGTGFNSVRTRTMLSTSGASGAFIERTAYIDGIGRTAEEVTRTSASAHPSLVTLQEYDGFGRKASAYQPLALASNNGGAYVTPDAAKGRAFMTYNDVYADSYPDYEATPRDRTTAIHGPGSPWRTRNKASGTQYLVSTKSGICSCSFYEPATATSIRKSGKYGAGELTVVQATDEDGKAVLTFTDKWGRTVMERRVVSSGTYADTRYVYDDLGLLRYVITPEADAALTDSTWDDSNATLQALAHIYKYDSRGRMTYAKRPGAGASHIRYDKADRPVFTQDGVQRQSGLWTFTLRDFLGRECVSGTAAVTASAISSVATSDNVPTVTFTTASGGSALGGYSSSWVTLPSSRTLLAVSYYDNYSFTSLLPSATASKLAVTTLSGYGTAWPSNSSPGAKGLLTGGRSYLVGDGSSYAVRSVYYDWHPQPVQTHEVDHRGVTTDGFLALSFSGKTTAARDVVTLSPGTSTVVTRTLAYDGWERLTGETVNTAGKSDQMSYTYDAAGRMTGRRYGSQSSSGSTAETLSYNVRGWLTGQSSDVFSSTLEYADPSRSATGQRYNGCISEWTWSRGSGSDAQTYAFSYDGLDRLTDTKRYVGASASATYAFTEKGLTYDLNGNIKAVMRYGASATAAEDNLGFTLDGNRISSLTNTGTKGSGATYTAYAYDANGNTTHDGRTGQDISWNALNLISGVSMTSGGTTTRMASYSWYADGTKDAALRSDGSGYVYKGNLIYEKTAGGALTLDCVLTPGGRIAARRNASGTVTGYDVLHHINDHLGSVRAVVDAATGTVIETSDYLPYGTRWSQTGGSAAQTLSDPDNRWRYSGKEEQKALHQDLPLIDYGARMYDPTVARWMSPDPLAEKYYPMTPYGYCINNPLLYSDPFGLFISIVVYQESSVIYKYDMNKQSFVDPEGNSYSGDDAFILGVTEDLNTLCEKAEGEKLVSSLVNNDKGVELFHSGINGESESLHPMFSGIVSKVGFKNSSSTSDGTSFTALAHELAHSWDRINGTMDNDLWFRYEDNKGELHEVKNAEKYATFMENLIRAEHAIPLRKQYFEGKSSSLIISSENEALYFDNIRQHRKKYRQVPRKNRYIFKSQEENQ